MTIPGANLGAEGELFKWSDHSWTNLRCMAFAVVGSQTIMDRGTHSLVIGVIVHTCAASKQ